MTLGDCRSAPNFPQAACAFLLQAERTDLYQC